MNKLDLDYQNLLKDILENGVKKETRNGGTISVFGRQIRHNMKDGFPLLTTKKMPFKTIVTELLWFLQGNTNIKYLVDNNCHIWNGDCYNFYCKWVDSENKKGSDDANALRKTGKLVKQYYVSKLSQEEFINKIKTDDEFAKKWGSLGKIYGHQWRRWTNYTGDEINEGTYEMTNEPIDQISELIRQLKDNPDSRRLLISAWNPAEVDDCVLPPCHYGFQVYTRELSNDERIDYALSKNDFRFTDAIINQEDYEKYNIPTRAISLMWNQRSCDLFLGIPFNIASYGLLLEIIAKEVNMIPDELIGNLGDVHLYSNHIEQAKEQIGREFTEEEIIEHLQQSGMDALKNEPRIEYISKLPKRTREPFTLPTVTLPSMLIPNTNNWDKLVLEDFYLNDYQSHPTIKAPLSN